MATVSISESTNHLRDKIRIYQTLQRNAKRENETDSMRPGLGEITQMIEELEYLTEKDVSGLACRIKRRKRAGFDDMFRLSHAFLQSEQNIVTFMKIPGALNVIVKELTGSDSKLQIFACEVLCNLSLGDGVSCEKVAATAGSYLITNLDSSDLRLQKTSLWVITNILHTKGKGANILTSQEIAAKLLHLLVNNNPELTNEILVALDILLDNSINLFNSEQLVALRNYLQGIRNKSGLVFKILFTLYYSNENPLIEQSDFPNIIEDTVAILHHTENAESQEYISRILYSTRILGNLVSKFPHCCEIVDNYCTKILHVEFVSVINKIFTWNIKDINKELLWLVGNFGTSQMILNKPENITNCVQISNENDGM